MLKVIFMGTPDFALKSLEKVFKEGHEIIGVVTNPDRPKGRGLKVIETPVKEFALNHNIPVMQPEKIRGNNEFIEKIQSLNPDIICVVAYGKILPQELLDIPKLGAINVHGSLLPKYRGAAPIQWAVINGEKKTGITTMYMDSGMDTGDMILKKEVQIGENETTGELWERLGNVGAELLIETLDLVEKKAAPREKQVGDFSLAPMLKKEMAKIDWENTNVVSIKNLVRGLNPIMGAYSFLNGKKLKFWKVDILDEKKLYELFPELRDYSYKMNELVAGTVLFSDSKKGLFVKGRDGIVQVLEVQAENSKKMNILDFLRGNQIIAGSVFE